MPANAEWLGWRVCSPQRQVAPWEGSAVENFRDFVVGTGAGDPLLILKCFGGCPGTCMGWQVADSCSSYSMLLWGVSAGSTPLSPTYNLLAGCVHMCTCVRVHLCESIGVCTCVRVCVCVVNECT